jgi:hypothetical protein
LVEVTIHPTHQPIQHVTGPVALQGQRTLTC